MIEKRLMEYLSQMKVNKYFGSFEVVKWVARKGKKLKFQLKELQDLKLATA